MNRCEYVMVANEKGGCGKTTTVLSLSTCLTALGYRVLCVDLDPSGNLTCAALPDLPTKVLYDVFEGTVRLPEAIVRTDFGDVLPTAKDLPVPDNGPEDTYLPLMQTSTKSLSQIADRLIGQPGAEQVLRRMLRKFPGFKLSDHYDFVLIDVGPSDNVLVRNAIYACDDVLIPCEQDSGALNGVHFITNSIRNIEQIYNKQIPVDGLLVVNYSENWGSQRKSSGDIDYACELLGISKYRTVIRNSANFPDSHRTNRPILDFVANGNGATDSMNMALEFLERRGLEPREEYPGVTKDADGHWVFNRIRKGKEENT